jgi:putative glutamine amidotransferase
MLNCVRCPVNSMHHQGIKTLGRDLLVSATADDGLIEAIEGQTDGFCMGVQWHPEVFEMTDPHTRQLFGAFIEAAASWAKANDPVFHAPRMGVGAP